MYNCVLESKTCCSSTSKSANESPTSILSLLSLIIAFYGCLSQGFNSSLTEQQRLCVWAERSNGNCSVVPIQVLLQMTYCERHAIWLSFGHLGQRFNAGIVKRFVQSHVFAHSPSDWHSSDKISSQRNAALPISVKMFHCSVICEQR